MTQNKASTSKTRISADQLAEVIAGSAQRADDLRGRGFGALSNLKRAKLVQTRFEYARLAARHGEEDALTRSVGRKMSVEHHSLVASRSEQARIEAPRIERNADAWQLHGYLRDQDGYPRSRYTVALYPDPEGIETALASARTNSTGYFQLSLALAQQQPQQAADATAAQDSSGGNILPGAAQFIRQAPIYLGAQGGKQAVPFMDPRALVPAANVIAYRDLIFTSVGDTGSQCHFASRLLGNSASRELHATDNEKRACHLAAIRPDHRVYFQSEAQAEKIGYDFCGHCFGKERSKR